MPTEDGRFKGIAVQRVPWHEKALRSASKALDPEPKTEGDWVEQYEHWREARGYVDPALRSASKAKRPH